MRARFIKALAVHREPSCLATSGRPISAWSPDLVASPPRFSAGSLCWSVPHRHREQFRTSLLGRSAEPETTLNYANVNVPQGTEYVWLSCGDTREAGRAAEDRQSSTGVGGWWCPFSWFAVLSPPRLIVHL